MDWNAYREVILTKQFDGDLQIEYVLSEDYLREKSSYIQSGKGKIVIPRGSVIQGTDAGIFRATPELASFYLEPTGSPDTYRVIRSFKMPDGTLWDVPPLVLIVSQEISVTPLPEMQEDTKLVEVRVQLVSVDDQNGILENSFVYEENGQTRTEKRKEKIPIKIIEH